MASVVKRPNGHRWIQFKGPDGKRKTIRLGKVDDKHAHDVRRQIEELIGAKTTETPVKQSTADWVADLPFKLHERLVATGLIQAKAPEQSAPKSLAEFLEYRLSIKQGKPSTLKKYGNTKANLIKFFGSDRDISTITPGDAEEFRFFLLTSGGRQRKGQGLAETTVRKRLSIASEFFGVAVKKRWIAEDPFDGVTVKNPQQIDREFHVDSKLTWKIIDAIRDDEFKLLFAVARFGGLRCNSETSLLRWSWIDWADESMTFRSPKTEHLRGRDKRTIPLFAELRPFLDEAWAKVQPGDSDLVFPHLSKLTSQALANRLGRVCRRVGVELWPKPWVNVRGTRENELVEHFPIKSACEWIGNDEATAKRHYLRVTKEHLARAVASGAGAERPAGEPKQTRSTKRITKRSIS